MGRKKTCFFFLSLLFFLAFFYFSWLVKKDLFVKTDFDLMVKIQDHIPKKYDRYLSLFSLVGSFEIYSLIILVFVLMERKALSFLIFLPFLAAHIMETLGKSFIDQPPPPFFFNRFWFSFNFPTSYIRPGYSYPSGHSLRTIFISLFLLYLILKSKLKKPIQILLIFVLLVFNVIMMLSRVSLGEHWATDVIGGGFLGASAAFFAFLFL